ncbi:anaerobic ribonucleoside-triphosphate reductase activating protein [Brachymonas denitrificans]|jgi:pyruvate formate lyase activating enzyme|uniref:anaerobic ribonucleoside-triphosphate reductase activating protein n=1 Tax=Brachymonas denitrificans TaxID=28220 RepID=UPI001BCB78A1|nr:anaerobic ribonucleoside-triphosphate reductase activating protein [Brachymonas denitrificans]
MRIELHIPACPGTVPATALRLGGLTPLTTIDFPGRLAAVLYCQGCPWRCSYCHNPELLPADTPAQLSWSDALGFLQQRLGLLDGVVFSGGEPTLQAALPAALQACRELGLQTGLHTGGMYLPRLVTALPLLDWVGLDIKALPARYPFLTATPASGSKPWEALDWLLASGIDHEVRTTWHAGLFDVEELLQLARALSDRGVQQWALQECRSADAPLWTLQDEQLAELNTLFARFTLRR